MALALNDVLDDPARAAAVLERSTYGCSIDNVMVDDGRAVIDVAFAALPGLPSFPIERVQLIVHADGRVRAMPLGPEREWKHRYPDAAEDPTGVAGSLCLYLPNDLRPLVWTWEDGLENYLALVQRHLMFEEWNRRTGHWPIEDAPHGRPRRKNRHPIKTGFMMGEVQRWAQFKR
jgi:hypothetical protein